MLIEMLDWIKLLRLKNTLRSVEMFFKIGVLKFFENFTGKH